jgi:hypothetical protein
MGVRDSLGRKKVTGKGIRFVHWFDEGLGSGRTATDLGPNSAEGRPIKA